MADVRCGPAAGPARAPAGRSNTATATTRWDHAQLSITAGQRPRPDFWHPTGEPVAAAGSCEVGRADIGHPVRPRLAGLLIGEAEVHDLVPTSGLPPARHDHGCVASLHPGLVGFHKRIDAIEPCCATRSPYYEERTRGRAWTGPSERCSLRSSGASPATVLRWHRRLVTIVSQFVSWLTLLGRTTSSIPSGSMVITGRRARSRRRVLTAIWRAKR